MNGIQGYRGISLRYYFLAAVIEGVVALLLLLLIPGDPKNALFLGFSALRLSLAVGLLVPIMMFFWLAMKSWNDAAWLRNMTDQLEASLQRSALNAVVSVASLTGLIGGIFLLVSTYSSTDTFVQARLIRIAPLILWMIALSLQSLVALHIFGYGILAVEPLIRSSAAAIGEFIQTAYQRIPKLLSSLYHSYMSLWIDSEAVEEENNSAKSLLTAYILVVSSSLVFFSGIYILLPQLRASLISEDQVLENATALLFFGSFVWSLFSIFRNRGVRAINLVVPILSLIAFLDEVSFGMRVFGFSTLQVGRSYIDGVHDFFQIGYHRFTSQENRVYFVIGFVVLLLILLIANLRPFFLLIRRTSKARLKRQPMMFTLLAIFFGLVALAIDLDAVEFSWMVFAEELLELNAGIALLFGSIAISSESAQDSPQKSKAGNRY